MKMRSRTTKNSRTAAATEMLTIKATGVPEDDFLAVTKNKKSELFIYLFIRKHSGCFVIAIYSKYLRIINNNKDDS